jgi:hypothetical protein
MSAVLGAAPLMTGPDAHRVELSASRTAAQRGRDAQIAADLAHEHRWHSVRLANLAPAVIFADANILSYRADQSDGYVAGLRSAVYPDPADGSTMQEYHARASLTTIDACQADDDGSSTDHEVTITLFFTADSTPTHVSGEYTLWRQANDSAPVALVRHVLRDGRQPFLQYRYVTPNDAGADSLALVPRSLLPISRRDTVASVVDVRALRAVEWRFLVPFDSTTRTSRIARVHLVTSLPAIGQLDRHECREVLRDPPLLAFGPRPSDRDVRGLSRPVGRRASDQRQNRATVS